MDEQSLSAPPKPPEMQRRITMYPAQFIGMCLIALVPLLALVGVFGERIDSTDANNSVFSLHVDYPALFRYKTDNLIMVRVENRSSQVIDTATVSLTTSYIARFSNVVFTPDASRVTSDAYEVELENIQPNEGRVVTVELEARDAGRFGGVIRVSASSVEPLQANITTMVFP